MEATTIKDRGIKYICRYSWKVLYDPLEIGGFEKGTRFATEDIIHMLRFQSLSLGTILGHHSYGRFTVAEGIGRQGSCQPRGEYYSLSNTKYFGVVDSGQKLKLVERSKE